MEYETPDVPRTDPLITVESADPRTPAAASHAAQHTACRHRLRWRDLSFGTRYRIVQGLGFSVAALVVAIGCVVDGVYALRAGLVSGDGLLFLRGCSELALFPFLAGGPIAYLRVWRSTHRPERATVVNHTFVLLVLVIILGLNAEGREWIVLLAFPAFMVRGELRRLRRMLTDRSNCATDPTRPIALRLMTVDGDRWPVTDEHRAWVFGPRVVVPGFDSWRCPHALFWVDLRRKAKVEWPIWAASEVLYWMGLMLTFSAMFVHDDRLIAASPIPVDIWTLLGVLVVLAYLLQLAYRASHNSPLLHRTDTAVYVLGTLGHLLIAALTACMALELDRPYFWAVTVLALIQAKLVVDLLIVQTPASSCDADPQMHRRVRASLKSGRVSAPC